MPDEAARDVFGFEGDAGVVAETGVDVPAGGLRGGGAAEGCDEDVVDGGAVDGVCDVACAGEGRCGAHRD